MSLRQVVAQLGIALGALIPIMGACNSGTGDCPAKQTIQPGAPCSDDNLQCAYDLPTPSPACDGTSTVIPSSCICTSGAWSCPSAISCGDGGGSEGGGDDGSAEAGDDGGGDAAEGGSDALGDTTQGG
jgi:hypothetical protein